MYSLKELAAAQTQPQPAVPVVPMPTDDNIGLQHPFDLSWRWGTLAVDADKVSRWSVA